MVIVLWQNTFIWPNNTFHVLQFTQVMLYLSMRQCFMTKFTICIGVGFLLEHITQNAVSCELVKINNIFLENFLEFSILWSVIRFISIKRPFQTFIKR